MPLIAAVLLLAAACYAQNPTPLWVRGYSVIPSPRNVSLADGDTVLDAGWRIDTELAATHVAVRSLVSDLRDFHALGFQIRRAADGTSALQYSRVIRLSVKPGAVHTGAEAGVDRQAYRLEITDSAITITGNSEQGLFYGVQTLLQLVKRAPAGLLLPHAVIEDWPAFQLRFLHWDTKNHQDRIETIKRYLDWAARMKVNMIAFELEDKFEYPSHPAIGAPGAFTTAQLQEIVDYGLERYIQVVPDVQAPAHFSYVLKHPEFASLRADGNNYQADLCNPRTYDLIFSMYDDVVKATKGVDYFFVSTDEVYYAGIGATCEQPYNPVNRSLKWVEFVRKAHEHLAAQGRRILVWAEYPLFAEHVRMIPPDVIDGVIGEPEFVDEENKLGMRQLAYTYIQGSELLFPDYLPFSRTSACASSPAGEDEGVPACAAYVSGHLREARETITSGRVWRGKPIGVFGAAWDDSGLHNETFWLGWSAIAQYGWSPGKAPLDQHEAEFMNFYYGPRVENMPGVYRALQQQARAWERTWQKVTSRVRGPGYGNSEGKGIGTTRRDDTLDAPSLPSLPKLFVPRTFAAHAYSKFVDQAPALLLENDRLARDIQANFARAGRNRYNLEVLYALSRFIGHHWRLILALGEAEHDLAGAEQAEGEQKPERALAALVRAYNAVAEADADGARVYADLLAVYHKSRFPKGRSVAGRDFYHVLDDTKDHWAARTADERFMMAAEDSIGLKEWRAGLLRLLNEYAAQHNLKVRGLGDKWMGE